MEEDNVWIYDRTWEGMLTSVFDAFSLRRFPVAILGEKDTPPLFTQVHRGTTDEEKAGRVFRALQKKLSAGALVCLTTSLCSELPALDMPLFRYICKAVKSGKSIETNFADADVLFVTNVYRKVRYERLRMMQFVRFQKTVDGTYFSMIEPDYDVLPLILPHFSDRFSEERWLIYDRRRRYGYYYADHQSVRVTFEEGSEIFRLPDGRLSEAMRDGDEMQIQDLWRMYFKAICIKERMNPKKHRKDLPVRYWKYLTEKQPGRKK
ncbi:MAG: TIGR03915 family putative DNA repair protein [Paraprevotella sp.]|nr:TIGR03915 family putative DNA repair protein [Paraprevotella sp.]